MDRHREERISRLVREMRTPADQTTDSEAGPSWRGADALDGEAMQAKPEPESGSDEYLDSDSDCTEGKRHF